MLMFIPFAWSVITSFKTLPDSVRLTVIPQPVHDSRGGSTRVTKLDPPLLVLFLNSFVVAGVVTLINLVLGSIAGYAFARLRFPGREVLFLIVLATLMIPDQLRLVPGLPSCSTASGSRRASCQYVSVILVLAVSGDEHLPAAPVLPHDPARPRGGGAHRRRRASSRRSGG